MSLNIYQWAVLALLFILAVNEVRLSELNGTARYSVFRAVGLYVSYGYVAFSLGTTAVWLFIKLGTL